MRMDNDDSSINNIIQTCTDTCTTDTCTTDENNTPRESVINIREQDRCRICFDKGNLTSLCHCKRGHRYHLACIQKWRGQFPRMHVHRVRCEICLGNYNIEYELDESDLSSYYTDDESDDGSASSSEDSLDHRVSHTEIYWVPGNDDHDEDNYFSKKTATAHALLQTLFLCVMLLGTIVSKGNTLITVYVQHAGLFWYIFQTFVYAFYTSDCIHIFLIMPFCVIYHITYGVFILNIIYAVYILVRIWRLRRLLIH